MNQENIKSGKNVVLIGMMGVGKTAFGRQLADALGYDFVDLDAMLEDVCNLKLHEIYRKYGRVRFAAEETLLLKKQLGRANCVIAAGGALPPVAEQLALWQALGVNLWLKAAPGTMLRRIKKKHNQVFLPPHTDVETELAARQEAYAAVADWQLDLENMGIEEAAGAACKWLAGKL